MSVPLEMSFDVDCPREHAFDTWTSGIATWWPADHTVSGESDLHVVLEPRVGGRIYERTSSGVEHDWGTVTGWKRPSRLIYEWHIGRDKSEATVVEITFSDIGSQRTRVEIEHRGWERFGPVGEERRAQNVGGWESVLPIYRAALEEGMA